MWFVRRGVFNPRQFVQGRVAFSFCLQFVKVASWQAPSCAAGRQPTGRGSPETAHLRSKAGGALIGGELEPGGNGERAPKVGGSMYDGTPCGGTTVVTGFSGPMMALSASGTCLGGWDPKFAVTRPALRHFGVSHHHLIQLQSGSNASSPFFEEGPDVSPFVHRLWSRTSSLACGLAPRENLDATCTAHYLREEVPSF